MTIVRNRLPQIHQKIKKKNTGCELKNLDVLPTTCSFIEQQCKSYRDFMLRHQKLDILSKIVNKVNVTFYPSATTKDITDHLRPAMRKKPDVIIIHTGTK